MSNSDAPAASTIEPKAASKRPAWQKVVGFAVAAIAGYLIAHTVGSWLGRDNFDKQLAANLEATAAQIRKQAPIKVDAVTTLNGAIAMENMIIYTMTVSDDIPTNRIAEAQAYIEKTDIQRACADAGIRKLIGAGAKMRWIYTDSSGDQFQANLAKCP